MQGREAEKRGVRPEELWARVAHLDGKPITIGKACEKYGFGKPSVYRWIELGLVRVLEDRRRGKRGGPRNKRLINEADVAYAALVARVRGVRQGRAVFTDEFLPPHAAGRTLRR